MWQTETEREKQVRRNKQKISEEKQVLSEHFSPRHQDERPILAKLCFDTSNLNYKLRII